MIYVDYLIKILSSIALGALVGWERERQNKPMGLRDIMLVTLGATLLTIIAFELPKLMPDCVNYDIGRIIAYTIASIGFLGSGIIIQNKNRFEGITTASLLFSVLAVGFLCGLGLYALAVISSVAIFLILKLKYIKIELEKGVKKCKKRKQK